MKNILVPFSDDPATKAAVGLAVDIANDYGGLVEILRAIEPPHVVINDIVPAAYVTQLHEQQQADATAHNASRLTGTWYPTPRTVRIQRASRGASPSFFRMLLM